MRKLRLIFHEKRQIWSAFSILEMQVRHFHRTLLGAEPDRSFGAPRLKTCKPSLFWKTYSSACAKVRSGRKLENAKSARIKRQIIEAINMNEVPENRLPETRNGAYQKLTSSVFAEEHCKLENPCHPSWKSSK